LANELHKDLWINVPAHATDDYVSNLAALVRDTLAPDLNVYVEYSNEVWNGGYEQYTYNRTQTQAEIAAGGSNLNYDGSSNLTTLSERRYGRRTREVAELFRQAWAGVGQADPINTRVRVILGGQVASQAGMVNGLVYLNQFYGAPKNYLWGLGVAPYINLGSNQNADNLTADQVIASLNASITAYDNGTDANSLKAANTTAANYNLHLVGYEGGVDTFNEHSISAKAAASNDPRMKDIVTRYLNMWYAKGGELFNWYTDRLPQLQYTLRNLEHHRQLQQPERPEDPGIRTGRRRDPGESAERRGIRLTWWDRHSCLSYAAECGGHSCPPPKPHVAV